MEAAMVEEQVEAEAPQEPAAVVTARKMFKYSQYVHIGEGALDCPVARWLEATPDEREGDMPACENPEHFHAWCRLPNPYQHQDIRAKAMAAKARKIRELKDPESDASVVLDQELAGINDPVFVETIIDELIARDFADDYMTAQTEVGGREEFEHIDQDQEEYNRLRVTEDELPEDEQSDEFKRLAAHMTTYIEAIRETLLQVQEPKKQQLRDRPVQSLVEVVRDKRVEDQAERVFMDTYAAWMWFVGTFKPQPHPTLRRPHIATWEQIGSRDRAEAGTMFGSAPEVVEELREVYTDLQLALQRGSAGN